MSAANVPAMPRHQAIVERHFQDPSTAEHDVRASRVNAVVASHVARHRCRPPGVCRRLPYACWRVRLGPDTLVAIPPTLPSCPQHAVDLPVRDALALPPSAQPRRPHS